MYLEVGSKVSGQMQRTHPEQLIWFMRVSAWSCCAYFVWMWMRTPACARRAERFVMYTRLEGVRAEQPERARAPPSHFLDIISNRHT